MKLYFSQACLLAGIYSYQYICFLEHQLYCSGPGSIIICLQIGVCAYGMLPFDWGWLYSFLFGAILSPTDPVSVVDLLKRTKATSKLTTVIAGESLLNDSSAVVLYLFFAGLCNGDDLNAATLILFVLKMVVFSPLVGFIFGYISYRITRFLQRALERNIDIVIALSLVCAYLSFFVGQDVLEGSGILSCCVAGSCYSVFISTSVLENEKMVHVWHHLEWACNTLIFLLAGILGGLNTANNVSVINLLLVLLMYVVLMVTRVSAIAMLWPMLNKLGKPFTLNEASFAGLNFSTNYVIYQ